MDARERLRIYLEQRREMGETELVLDSLTVDEAMRLLGAGGSGRSSGSDIPARGSAAAESIREPEAVTRREPQRVREPDAASQDAGDAGDWRAMLSAADGSAPGAADARRPRPSAPPTAQPSMPGIIGSHPAAGASTLDEIAGIVAGCRLCPLGATATNPVPGEGSAVAQLMCVGEAPGATEDETGRPFIGAAGKLLTNILAAIQLPREEVFICNVLKHRPPGNRNPAPDEVAACSPYLLRQLEIVRPKVILALGTFAAQTLLETKLTIGKLRGTEHAFHGIPLIVTYHPAALLRNPAWKRPTWEDVQHVRRILDRIDGA